TITRGNALTSTICRHSKKKASATFRIRSLFPSRNWNARTDHLRHGRRGLDIHARTRYGAFEARPSGHSGQFRQIAISSPDWMDEDSVRCRLSANGVPARMDGGGRKRYSRIEAVS